MSSIMISVRESLSVFVVHPVIVILTDPYDYHWFWFGSWDTRTFLTYGDMSSVSSFLFFLFLSWTSSGDGIWILLMEKIDFIILFHHSLSSDDEHLILPVVFVWQEFPVARYHQYFVWGTCGSSMRIIIIIITWIIWIVSSSQFIWSRIRWVITMNHVM